MGQAAFFWGACCCGCGWVRDFSTQANGTLLSSLGFSPTVFANNPVWSISGGRLNMTGGNGSLWKTSPPPFAKFASGGVIQYATCWQAPGSSQSGIFIGTARTLFIDWTQATPTLSRQACDAHGLNQGNPTVIAGVTPAPGDKLGIAINAQGNGNFGIQYIRNGAVLQGASETAIPLPGLTATGGTGIISGVWGDTAAQFGEAELDCGEAGCACLNAPSNWSVSFAGMTDACSCPSYGCHVLNGTFELAYQGQVFVVDQFVCEWLISLNPPCEGSLVKSTLTLTIDQFGNVVLTATGGSGTSCLFNFVWSNKFIELPGQPCQSSYVLPLTSQSGACGNVPASVTVQVPT